MDLAKTSEWAQSLPAQRETRARALLTATISTFDNALSTPCLVNNISPSGARITISESIPIGAEFRISIPQRNIFRTARQVWRKGDQLGVAFQPEAGPTTSPEDTEKDRKILAMEAEVASLKAAIGVLQYQLNRREET